MHREGYLVASGVTEKSTTSILRVTKLGSGGC